MQLTFDSPSPQSEWRTQKVGEQKSGVLTRAEPALSYPKSSALAPLMNALPP